jgi:3-oxoacyl-[acyl-carrier-protein] synthase-3
MMLNARITGLGKWIPPQVRLNSDWGSDFQEVAQRSSRRELIDIEMKAECPADEITIRCMKSEEGDPFLGARERRIAAPEVTPNEAAAWAAQEAIKDASIDPKDIDVVLSWDVVPELPGPSGSSRVAHLIGATNAYGLGIDSACATFLHQLDLANALIKSQHAKVVLLTQTHLLTRAIRMNHPASPTIGELATAVIVTANTDPNKVIHPVVSQSFGEDFYAVVWSRGKDKAPWYLAGGDYYLGTLDPTRARELVRTTVRVGAETVLDALQKGGCKPEEVSALISVQPRRWLPSAIAEAAGITAPAPTTFDQYCHLGSCGLVANLIKAREMGLLTPGANTVFYGQGAGFIKASTLITW